MKYPVTNSTTSNCDKLHYFQSIFFNTERERENQSYESAGIFIPKTAPLVDESLKLFLISTIN